MPAKMTAKQANHYTAYVDQMTQTIATFRHPALARSVMPADWTHLARKEVPKKERVTLRLDGDVLRFFRKLGPGYQAELNGVLRAFMLARLAEVLGPDPSVDLGEEDEMSATEHQLEVSMAADLERIRRRRVGF